MVEVAPSTNSEGKDAKAIWVDLKDAEDGSAAFKLALMELTTLQRLDSAREMFVSRARHIAEHLLEIADKVEKDPTRRPNSLGELQSNASELNALCGVIDGLRTALVGPMR